MHSGTLGVIGGLGPMATTYFMDQVTRMTQTHREQDHLDMIVYNFPSIPDRTGYILGSNLKSPLPGLLWAGRALAREQVTCLAIPSVTAHFFYEELSDELRIPIINTVQETARYLKEQGVGAAGIMATDGTIVSGLFSEALLAEGIRPVLPVRARQEDVMHLIYQNVKAGVPAEMDKFRAVEADLRSRGAEVIVLGCTELAMIGREQPLEAGFLDTTGILAREAILRCGKQIKPEMRTLIS